MFAVVITGPPGAGKSEVGSEMLLVTATIEDDEHLRSLLGALDVAEHLLVLLHADPETMRERLLSREPPGWSGLPELLNASRRLAATMPDLEGIGLAIATDGRRPSDVAAELRVELDRRRGAGAGR